MRCCSSRCGSPCSNSRSSGCASTSRRWSSCSSWSPRRPSTSCGSCSMRARPCRSFHRPLWSKRCARGKSKRQLEVDRLVGTARRRRPRPVLGWQNRSTSLRRGSAGTSRTAGAFKATPAALPMASMSSGHPGRGQRTGCLRPRLRSWHPGRRPSSGHPGPGLRSGRPGRRPSSGHPRPGPRSGRREPKPRSGRWGQRPRARRAPHESRRRQGCRLPSEL
mmetsp:Transcript_65663/g.186318  ORF Transcript_65663/g.186318 Transcript_65663/m.186318 type:complete len:220 (-) Transcript_65663:711-1370(-)